MRARIYQPARTAMSSGTAKTHVWLLEFDQENAREIDPLMGWTSMTRKRRSSCGLRPKKKQSNMRRITASTPSCKSRTSAAPIFGPVAMVKTLPQRAAVPGPTKLRRYIDDRIMPKTLPIGWRLAFFSRAVQHIILEAAHDHYPSCYAFRRFSC